MQTSRATQIRRLAMGALRYPRSVRHVPRLAKSYGHTNLELRQPWLPFEVIDLLGARVRDGTKVFEYGGGGSTAWFADHVGATGRVVTVEHDPKWSRLLADKLAGEANVELLTPSAANDYAAYVAAIDSYPDNFFDVVVVDGRERVRCFEHAIPKVRRGGLLILDDVDRQRYERAQRDVDWPRQVFHGYAPCKDDVAHTAVFSRPA